MAKRMRIPIFVGAVRSGPAIINVELSSDSSLYDAMDVIDEEIGEGGKNGLYPSLYRFFLKGTEEQVTVVDLSDTTVKQCLNDNNGNRYLRLEKTKSIWNERDTDALVKKAEAVKAKMKGKQNNVKRKNKKSKIDDLPAMDSACSTFQKICEEFGKLGRSFKSFNDVFLTGETVHASGETITSTIEVLQTAGSVLSCAPMVGAVFAMLVPISEAIIASRKVKTDMQKHLDRVLATLTTLREMADVGEECDLSVEQDKTYCSFMVLLQKHICQLGEMYGEVTGFGKQFKRLWRASQHAKQLIEIAKEIDAKALETAAMTSLETSFNVKKVAGHLEVIGGDVKNVGEDVKNVGEVVKNVGEAVKNVGEAVKNVGEDVGEVVKNVGEDVKNVGEDVKNVGEDVKNVANMLKRVVPHIADVKRVTWALMVLVFAMFCSFGMKKNATVTTTKETDAITQHAIFIALKNIENKFETLIVASPKELAVAAIACTFIIMIALVVRNIAFETSSAADLRKKLYKIYKSYKLDLFMVEGTEGNMDLATDFINLQVVEKKDKVQRDGDNAESERLDVVS